MSTEEFGPRQRGAATKRARTRRWILDAARPLLDEHGWYHVTLPNVAKSAGVSTATLSNHFKGKRDLVVAAYEAETLPFIERTERVITSKENSEEALASFVNELVVLLTVHPALNRAFLPVGREEDPADEVHPVLHRFVTLFGGLLDAYWQEAKFGESDEETAQHLIFALLAWIASFNPPPPVEQSVKNVLASILPTRN